ncbi:G protein-coupled receptor-like protein, partial [Dinothrombium tinctorium]
MNAMDTFFDTLNANNSLLIDLQNIPNLNQLNDSIYAQFIEINSSTVGMNSTGNSNETEVTGFDRNVYILPWWQQLIWSTIFGSMVLVATGGNLIVIWIHRRYHGFHFKCHLQFYNHVKWTLAVWSIVLQNFKFHIDIISECECVYIDGDLDRS